MKEIGLIIINFIVASLIASTIICLIERSILIKGFKLTDISKYIIFGIILIISGIAWGQIMAYFN
ncbi:hypothetical protein [Clostridium sp. JNZ J1-5]|nr:hypothetical protein [Clostridium sp.]